jgi:hypothetical protein
LPLNNLFLQRLLLGTIWFFFFEKNDLVPIFTSRDM